MEKNRVKIICNPYKKSIEYMRWCLDEEMQDYTWKELGDKSTLLTNEKYTNATIQHNAHEIVEEIKNNYDRGNVGLVIEFEGTKEDYNDLKEVIDNDFCNVGVTCEPGDLYIDSADDVMPEIQKVFINLAQVFANYGTEEVQKIIEKFLNVTKTEIPICVVGMYSTGKSAFINSLIGEEILPSDVNPTTARNYKIVESDDDDKGSVKFYMGNEKIIIDYEGDRYKIGTGVDSDLTKKIDDELKKIKNPSLTTNMYHSLRIINEYVEKTITELIEVEVPFYNGVLVNDQYKFIIFDTPGSDSISHKEHLHVLKKALQDQTNGLPILLTSPKDMDRTGVDTLLGMINEIDGSLDLTNTMIIVNQADTISKKSLDKINQCVDTILSNWKLNRLYFMSAIMGLGSKKKDYEDENTWIDDDYFETFFKNMDAFINCNGRLYKQLYSYNKVAPNIKENYEASVAGERETRKLLYINSGLHCVENEILNFARKYVLYNKCAQAQEYLKEAINVTKNLILLTEQKVEEIKEQAIRERNEEKKALLRKLSRCIEENTKAYADNYPAYMEEFVNNLMQFGLRDIDSLVTSIWSVAKEGGKDERVDKFLTLSKEPFIREEKKCRGEILQYSKKYWVRNKEQLQEECCKIVKAEEHLTPDEQKYLKNFIMNLDIYLEVDAAVNVLPDNVRIHLINIFGLKFLRTNRLDQKETKRVYADLLGKYIRRINATIIDSHTKEFRRWGEELKTGLSKRITELNPKLRMIESKIDEYRKEIKMYKDQLNSIKTGQDKMSQMFEFMERKK